MECLFWSIALIVIVWALLFHRASLQVGTGVLAIYLVVMTIGTSSLPIQFLLWLIFLAVAIPLNVPSLRKTYISTPMFAFFKRVTPPMSRTEKEALEAGSVWWDGDLFSGDPDWGRLRSFPKPRLTDEERAFLDGPVEELCLMLDDWDITNNRADLPPEVWRYLKEKGFFGMIIPKSHNGLGFSALAHSEVVQKVASRSMAAAVTVMVPNSLGPAELLMHYGTEEQKNRYLPTLASGEDVPCFALTSPEAGSDAASMPDRGVVTKGQFEGKEVLGINLTFDKRYITLSPVASLIGLAFRLVDPDHLIGEVDDIGITVALIPSSIPGVEKGRRHNPLNVAFLNGTVKGKDVFIPMEYVVGGQEFVGKGWMMLMERLAIGRSISLPAVSVAGAKYASRLTGAYARVRYQFHLPIGRFEGVEEKLANIAGKTYLMDAARTMTVGAVDSGERPSVISAIVKYNLTERLRILINDAMDIHAGSGISFGPRNVMGLPYMALPISVTVEGANILTRSLIVFGQGAIRCHPYVLKEMESVTEKDQTKALDIFDEAFFGHAGFTLSNSIRALYHGLTDSVTANSPGGKGKPYYQSLSRLSAAFALTSDVAMLVYGGELKRKERISGRLADALSNLYLASATLKKFEDDGRQPEDAPLMKWACETSLKNTQDALFGVFDNLPIRPIAWKLRFLIFPYGRTFKGPSDRLSHKVARILLTPSDTRERLTDGIFKISDPNDAAGRIEDAFLAAIKAEPAEKKLKDAVRRGDISADGDEERITEAVTKEILTNDEAELLRAFVEKRREVIAVDDFPADFGAENSVTDEPAPESGDTPDE